MGVFTNIIIIMMIMCLCRIVRTTQRAITVNAALQGSTVWSEVSVMTVNPALVPSPTQRTSKP